MGITIVNCLEFRWIFFYGNGRRRKFSYSLSFLLFLINIVFTVGGFHFHIATKKWPMLPGLQQFKIRVVVKVPLDWSNTLPCKRNFSKRKNRFKKKFNSNLVRSMARLSEETLIEHCFLLGMKIIYYSLFFFLCYLLFFLPKLFV